MATAAPREFITDVAVTVCRENYKDGSHLKDILKGYNAAEQGSCYHVQGSYQDMEDLFMKLSTLKHVSAISTKHPSPKNDQDKHPVKPVKPVEVDGVIMDYIVQARSKELQRMEERSDVVIETQPSPGSTAHSSKSTRKMLVTFKPRHRRNAPNPVHAHLVRERFVSFYQRIATDLQRKSLPIDPLDHKGLQRRFTQLLLVPEGGSKRTIVTGTFGHIAALEDFLLGQKNASSSSRDKDKRRSPVHTSTACATDSRSPVTSPARSVQPDAEEELCAICMDTIEDSQRKTLRCKHVFCRECLRTAFDYKPVCPTCGEVYGTLKGTQPEGGSMDVSTNRSSLPGYERHGTIVIRYNIPSGIQSKEHPSPGSSYEGASRTAYLPDSPEGSEVLALLQRAFHQRLVFTVGRSSTSGRDNLVTWNDIHHKTSTHGGPTCYGYPDPDYLNRVKDELKAKGIQ